MKRALDKESMKTLNKYRHAIISRDYCVTYCRPSGNYRLPKATRGAPKADAATE